MKLKTQNSKLKTHSDNRGFTLIEMFIAIFVLTVGLLAAAGLLVTTIQANASAKWTAAAITFATEEVEELIAEGWPDLQQDFAYTVPRNCPNFPALERQWRVRRAEDANNNVIPGLRQIDVRVTWDERGRTRNVTISTLVASP
ncbi:prepilin-type N-terminal cleavage/methylation domain-containing protein [Thermodesulfovibrionales bacterium]|nr:prepilin-type N-terminal cleavage/methylation domain-containing protein [Thermodesulfovibrionales bacterium]